tara:strand:- start:4039 stop:5976 length:1938 start_codon:yes stop_codon:yes gene_type:complete
MKKKRILYQSDGALAKTGFGRCSKALLSYLYATGKYEIFHYIGGERVNNENALKRTPWTSLGSLPSSDQELKAINADPAVGRRAAYGAHLIDKTIKEVRPDVYIAAQDIWGIDFALEKPWWKDISKNSALWTTLDSRPILPTAIEAAKKTDNYWIWSNFATKELNKMGYKHVETMHGPVETKFFKRLPEEVRMRIRKAHNIPEDAFVVGFVFRNQLRKSVPNLLEGYKLFTQKNRIKNPRLLLHTHLGEGWDIRKLAKEYEIPIEQILVTYICKECHHYFVAPTVKANSAGERECDRCVTDKAQVTANISVGVTENQLNDVYNIMDVYCHPFTSGGQEYPIQEAKLAGLITLVTNYSCGEEMCEPEANSLPLDWFEYREHGTEFIKASTDPKSISKQLSKVYKMDPEKRFLKGMAAREWVIKNYSIETIGKKFEEFIDSRESIDWDKILVEKLPKDPHYVMPLENMEEDEWLLHMYHNILNMKNVDKTDEGFLYWKQILSKGNPREAVEQKFREVAMQDYVQRKRDDFASNLSKDDEGRRILYVMPEGPTDIFLSTSLFRSIKEQYPEYNLYVATQGKYFPLLKGNKHIHKVIDFFPEMENQMWAEGHGQHKGFFEISFLPHFGTRKNLDYLHNGKDNIAFDLKY